MERKQEDMPRPDGASSNGEATVQQGADKEKRPREASGTAAADEGRNAPASKRQRSSRSPEAREGPRERADVGQQGPSGAERKGRSEHRSRSRSRERARGSRRRERSRSREGGRRRGGRRDRDRSRSRTRSRSRSRDRSRRNDERRSRDRSRSRERRKSSRRGGGGRSRSRERSRSPSRERRREPRRDEGSSSRANKWDPAPAAAVPSAPRPQALMRTPAELMAATQMHFAQLRAGGLLPNHPVAGMQLANMHNLLAGQQASQQPKTQSAEHKKKLLWSGKKTETAQATSATATTWANADLGDAARKEKFLKLMGAKKKENEALLQAPPPPPTEAAGPGQDKLFQELEREFMAGIGQGTSAKGLGFNW